jgi:hypothetical protein
VAAAEENPEIESQLMFKKKAPFSTPAGDKSIGGL